MTIYLSCLSLTGRTPSHLLHGLATDIQGRFTRRLSRQGLLGKPWASVMAEKHAQQGSRFKDHCAGNTGLAGNRRETQVLKRPPESESIGDWNLECYMYARSASSKQDVIGQKRLGDIRSEHTSLLRQGSASLGAPRWAEEACQQYWTGFSSCLEPRKGPRTGSPAAAASGQFWLLLAVPRARATSSAPVQCASAGTIRDEWNPSSVVAVISLYMFLDILD